MRQDYYSTGTGLRRVLGFTWKQAAASPTACCVPVLRSEDEIMANRGGGRGPGSNRNNLFPGFSM